MNKETSDKHYVFYEEKKVCNRGRARYLLASASFKKFPVSDEFSADVCVLPENYDERAYFNFIEKWGTVSTINVIHIGFFSLLFYFALIHVLKDKNNIINNIACVYLLCLIRISPV